MWPEGTRRDQLRIHDTTTLSATPGFDSEDWEQKVTPPADNGVGLLPELDWG